MAKAKTVLTPEQEAAKEMAELQKKAKKLKITFDATTPVDELKMLVTAGEAAAKAQKDAKTPTPPAPTPAAPAADISDTKVPPVVVPVLSDPPANTPAPDAPDNTPGEEPVGSLPEKDEVLQSLTTKNKETFHLVRTAATKKVPSQVQLKTKFGQVVANFDSPEQGKAHLENMSRF